MFHGGEQIDLHTQMLQAIELDNVDSVNAIIVVHKAEKGFTNLDCDQCLLIACRRGNPCIVAALAKLGHVWSTDEEGCKPIHRAVQSASLMTVQQVINSGAAVSSTDKNGHSPLHYAAKSGFCDIIKLLIQEGASPQRSRAHTNETPLHLACCHGNIDAVRMLLEHHADVNTLQTSSEEPSCLHIAVKNGHAEIVELLCQHGAEVNLTGPLKTYTPLHLAALSTNAKMVEILLRYGAEVNVRNKHGLTPLHLAVMNKSVASLKVLLQWESTDVLMQDLKGLTALHYAAFTIPEITELLLSSRTMDVNALRTSTGYTCLHYAAGGGNVEVVDLLLKAGHHVNVVDNTGLTPLHCAITRVPRALEVVKMLLQAGAIVDACSRNMPRPLRRFATQLIVGKLDVKILEELVSAGATLAPHGRHMTFTSRVKKSALCVLTRYGCLDIVRYLVESGWMVQLERDWINLQFGNASTNEILLYLREVMQQPWSLRESCRHVLRKHLSWCSGGTEITSRVDQLYLPEPLKLFLKIQDRSIL